ncbi:MAG: PQQ-binding-like beta-propeller repeat protein [Myxococcales bacterium]|nr:PQQ-binding-like beta-propeller repeat protein [Myxococcales bacterium]
MTRTRGIGRGIGLIGLGLIGGACSTLRPTTHVADDPGRAAALRVRWTLVTSDRSTDVSPQEFAGVATSAENVFGGSAGGLFVSVRALDGRVRWSKQLGAISSRPTIVGDRLFVGTDDGELMSVELDTGKVLWKYTTKGAILESPVVLDVRALPNDPADAVVVFSNEADQVIALDAVTGAFRWQYKAETPEEYTLRGHAGVVASGELVFTGFANGTLVALRARTGSVAWLTTLTGDADRFVDVDATPVLDATSLYVTSSSGGVWSIDQQTGLVRWRTPLVGSASARQDGGSGAVGGLALDGERLYVAAADLGVYALDLSGNVLWRHGTRGAGEPATPQVAGDYLIYALTDAGIYVADKRTGSVLEYFDPGDGVSADPVVIDDRDLYVLSNRGVLYAFDLRAL